MLGLPMGRGAWRLEGETMTEPTDAELDELRQANSGRLNFVTLSEFRTIARAVLAKWGTPPAVAGEPVFAFRRKGLDDFCTCTEERYAELSAKPNLFETRIFYTTPQPTQAQAGAVPLTDEQIEALPLWKPFVGLWPETRREIVRTIERHHGIKGGQHGTE
jgi:hypothetical protein